MSQSSNYVELENLGGCSKFTRVLFSGMETIQRLLW